MRPSHPILLRFSLPLAITVCVTLILILGSGANNWLRFDRAAILHGEIWRLLTAHFAHLGLSHAIMNLLGLWLCWLLFGKQLKTGATLVLIVSGNLVISLGLLLLNPEIHWYVGLSGVLHTLFVFGCLMEIRAGRKDAIVLLVFVAGKLIWEQLAGPLPGSEQTAGGKVVVDAHLYGAIAGLLLTPLLVWYDTLSDAE